MHRAMAAQAGAAYQATPRFEWGRCFVHPAFDYLFIGGGLSLAAAAVLWLAAGGGSVDRFVGDHLPILILLSNSAHFAASTVRLYTKPGAMRQLPFLSYIVPIITLAAVAAAILFADSVGAHLYSLYLTWSPYHYAAQAYGLSLMYGYRNGCEPTPAQRRLLFWSCMAGFALASVSPNDSHAGIWWFIPWTWSEKHPAFSSAMLFARGALAVLAVALPVAAFLWIQLKNKRPLPLISLLIPATNGLWFGVFPYMGALGFATVFHGIQYLAIVAIFHARDQAQLPGNRHSPRYHAAWFYLACLGLGYALFQCWPYGFHALLGLDYAASVIVITAAINIHHFVVDGYIWKLRKDPNYAIVTGADGARAPTAGVTPPSLPSPRRRLAPRG